MSSKEIFFVDETVISENLSDEGVIRSLRTRLEDMAYALNRKIDGRMSSEENLSGKRIYYESLPESVPENEVFRKIIVFGSLPDSTTKSVPHEINFTDELQFVDIRGAATNPGVSGIPVPQAGSSGTVSLDITGTNLNVTTDTDMTAYTKCFICIEYVKI